MTASLVNRQTCGTMMLPEELVQSPHEEGTMHAGANALTAVFASCGFLLLRIWRCYGEHSTN